MSSREHKSESGKRSARRHERLRERPIDILSEVLLYGILVVSTWLFGTTDNWAIQWMIGASILFGVVRLIAALSSRGPRQRVSGWVWALAALNALFLLYLGASIYNARATFDMFTQSFTYYEGSVPWLPTTYDQPRTLAVLLEYCGWTALFWGVRDWLIRSPVDREGEGFYLPPRLRRLLWVLAINAALLSLFGIFQRLSGTRKIFWTYPTAYGRLLGFFGPYPYRSNAVQYLNMLWPMMAGFAFFLRHRAREQRSADGPHIFLALLTVVVLLAPIVAASRGGLLVTAFCAALLVFGPAREAIRRASKWLVLVFLMLIGAGYYLVGNIWIYRLGTAEFTLGGRTEIYRNAQRIMEDYGVSGTGAGTFPAMYNLYRDSLHQGWHAYLHNDWWEALLTLGWAGFGIQCAMAIVIAALALRKADGPSAFPVPACVAVGMIGCMVHAFIDFPFRIWSLVAIFTVWAALLSVFSVRNTRVD